MENKKPFSIGYVLRMTFKHMRKSIDISIRKTFDRVKDFGDNQPEKVQEVFNTLSYLHEMRKNLDDYQLKHKEVFKE
jgi:hypothetical protein